MKQCFYAEESYFNPGKYKISFNHDNFLLKYTTGSYNIICARLMNLEWAQYLRMCRDIYGAELTGKRTYYIVPVFTDKARAQKLAKELNNRANLVLKEREQCI